MEQNQNGTSIRFSSRNSSQEFFLLNRLPVGAELDVVGVGEHEGGEEVAADLRVETE